MKIKRKYIIIVIVLGIILSKTIYDEIQNEIAFKRYIEYYNVVKDTFKVRRKGTYTNERIRGVNGYHYRSWIRAYEVKTPFMDKSFEVWVDNRKHEIFGDNFYDVISYDTKFQHLYSNWVKKQVGIEDENVELKFTGNFDTPYIEFDKIKTLSKDYKEIFENTHNLYLMEFWKKNIMDLNKNNWYTYVSESLVYFDKFKSLVRLNPLCDNNGYLVYLYKYDQDKYNVKDEDKYYGTFDEPNNIDTAIINKLIYEDKAEFRQFENEEEKKYTIDKYGIIIE